MAGKKEALLTSAIKRSAVKDLAYRSTADVGRLSLERHPALASKGVEILRFALRDG